MNETLLFQQLLIAVIPLIFAITVHEAAHGYMANYKGDDTAKKMGRLTLNPIKHIDMWGTIIIPLTMYFVSQGSFLFGYAKPVPINTRNFKNYKQDVLLTILAGPLSNLIMAFLWGLMLFCMAKLQINEEFFLNMGRYGIVINLVLFALNLFPILPLDGGRILLLFLPYNASVQFAKLEPYGFYIIILLSISGALSNLWIRPIVNFFNTLIILIF